MTSHNIVFSNFNQLIIFIKEHNLDKKDSLLVQIFSGVLVKKEIQKLSLFLVENLPKAKIIGATTDGEIVNDKVTTKKIVISFTAFEHSTLKLVDMQITSRNQSYDDGAKIAKNLLTNNSKVFIIFASGTEINSEEFLNGIKNTASDVIVSGGLAGDNATFTETFVISNDKVLNSSAVGVCIDSKRLHVDNKFSLAWQNIGKTFKVNKSYENILYEIDKMTPYELYKKYLGLEVAKRLPGIGIEFPLIVQKNGHQIARAALKLQRDGSIIFAGNIEEGSEVRFGIGNIEELLHGSTNLVNDLNQNKHEAIFIYSCMARRRFLEKKASLDIKNFNILAPTCGFFTYGEFFSTESCNELLNESLTILALSEDFVKNENSVDISDDAYKDILVKQKAISHLIDTTSKELDMLNKNLENEVKIKTDENIKQENYLFEKDKMAQMGEMIENIAHQWRQPLSAISSITSSLMIQRELGMIKNQNIDKELKKILNNTNFLSETINTFRNYIYEDNETKEVIFQNRLDMIIDVVSSTLKDNNIELINNIDYDKPILKVLKVGHLSQVILNIFNNAKDIIREKKIEKPWIKIDCELIKGQIITTIEDNAGGVRKDIIHKIFDPYFTTKHKSQGTGIGLYMSRNIIVNKLEGDLSVKNTENGAKFYIKIPQKS